MTKRDAKFSKKIKDKLFKHRLNVRKCFYCGKNINRKSATIDHIKPLSSGGTNRESNVVLSCLDCNREKSNMPAHEYKSIIRLRKLEI